MVKSTIKILASTAMLATTLSAPVLGVPNYKHSAGPNGVACSQVAEPNAFKRIAPKDSPTVTVKICYLTNSESFWPRRYNVVDGYLYLVNGVAYRVKALTESGCNDRPRRPKMDDYDYEKTSSLKQSFTPFQVAGDYIYIPRFFRNPCDNNFEVPR